MKVDNQFNEWWTKHLKWQPIPEGQVIPVLHSLQGHPESPCLWDRYISKIIIDEMGFQATTHEPCLYYNNDDNGLILILRQVDDFHVSAKTVAMCNKVGDKIRKQMTHPLNELGIIRKFNGVHADQTRDYTHLHYTSYIEHIVENHGWTHEFVKNKPVPMKSYPKYQNDIQLTEGSTDPYNAKQNRTLLCKVPYTPSTMNRTLLVRLTVHNKNQTSTFIVTGMGARYCNAAT